MEDNTLDSICIYDENELGWLWIYHKTDADLWESVSPRCGSWYVMGNQVWQQRLDKLRELHPEIPYPKLPRISKIAN